MRETKTSLTASRLRALNAVFDEGSYSAAARALKMSQPAVSQAVQDLERAFNVELFKRRGRRLVPTDICMELAPLTEEIRRLEDATLLVLQRGERLETGVLRVGIGNLMPAMALLGAFQQRFPNIQVQVEYAIFANIMDAVHERRVDVGILPNVPKDGRFHRQVCLTQDVVALIPMGHPLAAAQQVSLTELMGERLIFQKQGSVTQKVVDAAFAEAGLTPRPSLIFETGGEVYEAVANGLGVAFMWRHGTSRKDSVKRIPIVEIQASYDEFVFRRADTKSPVVDMFFATIDFLKL